MPSRIRVLLVLSAFFSVLAYGIPSHASTLTFCFKWNYSFVDQGFGEDGLRHLSGQAHGTKEAAYGLAHVSRNGSTVAHNVLNSSGCLAPIPRVAGTYQISISPVVFMPNGTSILVYRTETSGTEFFTWTTYYPSGGDSTSTRSFGTAGDPVTNAVSVAVQFAKESHIGIGPNQDYTIFAASLSDTGYYGSGIVHFGAHNSPSAGPDAEWKYVIAHELGHAIQDNLFGMIQKNYDGHFSTNPVCRCDHVDNTQYPLNQKHCLQSRETLEAAQNEGFAQFIALDAMNNDVESDGVFTYYKEFRWTNGGILSPPQGFLPRNAARWMKTKCPTTTSHVGIELDWMSFYFALHTIGGSANFYYTQIRDTYLDTCNHLGGNGTCSGLGSSNGPKWNGLTAAVGARYGSASARALHWNTQGAAFGVDQ